MLKELTEAFACHQASCRPPGSGGTGGSSPSPRISHIRGDIQRERKAISAELDTQGLDPMDPLRHIFESSMGNRVLVVRDDSGHVVGGVQYRMSKRDRTLDVTDMRMRNERRGDGTAAFRDIAQVAKDNGYRLSVRYAIDSAKPFYSKLGAVFQNGFATGVWPDKSRDALANGSPIPGGSFPYDIWVKMDEIFTTPTLSASAFLTEALACHEASCRPPTSGGTGGSSPSRGGLPGGLSPTEEGRVRPESKLRGMPWDEMERTVWKAYTGDLGNGYKSQVDESEDVYGSTSKMLSVRGTITNAHGREVGQFERTVYHKDGKLVVVHDLLTMDASAQGRGVGAAFNARAVEKYKAWGVDRIEMDAGYQVGGYAWAVAGFRVRGPGSAVQSLCGRGAERLAQALRVGQITQEQHDRLKTEIDEMYNAAWRGVDVQPIHIASWGRDVPFKQEGNKGSYMTWPGKEALLGSNWSGVYYFDAGAVTASADGAEEFYSPTQPRDREGQWTAFRSSITSLSRDTLDRAIKHGADGIFGAGQTAPTPWPRFPKLKGQRPYDPDLVAAKLRAPPVLEKVDPRPLYSTQPGLVRSHVDYYTGSEYHTTGRTAADQTVRENRFPIVYVRRDGRALILTGHHRAAAALVQGKDLDAIVVREP